ncbi:MAG: PilZ domain-containing protein [Alphaproteobacteria bacterium]
MIRRHLVGYARIERRRDRRRPTRLTARIGDLPVEIIDISLGGLGVGVIARAASPRAFRIGEEYRVVLDVPSYGVLTLSAEVARVNPARAYVGLRLVDLDGQTYRVIERLSIGRLPALP